jgi:hypothetical protein
MTVIVPAGAAMRLMFRETPAVYRAFDDIGKPDATTWYSILVPTL